VVLQAHGRADHGKTSDILDDWQAPHVQHYRGPECSQCGEVQQIWTSCLWATVQDYPANDWLVPNATRGGQVHSQYLSVYTFRVSFIVTSTTERRRRLYFHSCLFVCSFACLFLAKWNIFQVYWSVDFVNLSINVCQSPTGQNSKPIIMKLCHVEEVVSTEKPIDFGVKGHPDVRFLKSFFHPFDLKVERDLHIASLNRETNYFWDQKVKGQLKVKLLKSSISIWKIINFHPIDLSFD